MSIESVIPSSRLILCHPFLLLPPIPPSIRVFSNESALHIRWPKYWSFSFSISPSNEHPGLISFRMDWLDLLAVQGTLKSLLQLHSSKASIFRCSAFFTVQLSHPYMTPGKTIALTRRTFVGKVMSLLFNMLPRLVITFLPRSKHLLISWLQSPSAIGFYLMSYSPLSTLHELISLNLHHSLGVRYHSYHIFQIRKWSLERLSLKSKVIISGRINIWTKLPGVRAHSPITTIFTVSLSVCFRAAPWPFYFLKTQEFYFCKLLDNCCTMLCWFLLHNSSNQP